MYRSKTDKQLRSRRLSQKLAPLDNQLHFVGDNDPYNEFKHYLRTSKSPLETDYERRITAIYYKLPKIINQKPSLAERRKSVEPKRLKDVISALGKSPKNKNNPKEEILNKAPDNLDFTFGLD